jgi:hypothetical protein
MREVFGEHGTPNQSAVRAIKPTEVGDAPKGANPDKNVVNIDCDTIKRYPRCGDRCGDRSNGWVFIEKDSNFVQETPPV